MSLLENLHSSASVPRTMTPNPSEPQYGTTAPASHRSSASGRGVHFGGGQNSSPNNYAIMDDHEDGHDFHDPRGRRRRRSSFTARFGSLAQKGGVNSIENFARSWTRAAGFIEAAPHRPSLLIPADEEHRGGDSVEYRRRSESFSRVPRTSLLRAHIEASSPPNQELETQEVGGKTDGAFATTPRRQSQQVLGDKDQNGSSEHHLAISTTPRSGRPNSSTKLLASDIASVPASMRAPSLAPHAYVALPGSYGTSYGTIHSIGNKPSMAEANELWKKQQESGTHMIDGEHEPLIVKEVNQDGHMVLVVEGQSTLPQTVFNSTNVLIGVGLLSLPLGIKYAGWLIGMGFLFLSALVTAYTAKLLAKCMDCDPSLITFADLAFISYGNRARVATSILFTLELMAACVALIVLFADTLDLLLPGWGVVQWKIISGFLLLPLNFAPLRLLSFTSVLGILSCILIVLIIFIDGFMKPHAPGSLLDPATIHIFPTNWLTVPLSFGLLMSPWGGHSVFPNIYRDMRHPYKYHKAVKVTFTFTYLLDTTVAAVGILMFGEDIRTEVTASILATQGYLGILTIFISIFIAIIPLTKVPLNACPIVSTLEAVCGLDARSVSLPDPDSSSSSSDNAFTTFIRSIAKVLIRTFVIIIFVIISIAFPAFDSVVAFMGAGLCFAICVILPIMFYLKLFGHEVSMKERLVDYFIIAVSAVMAVTGTLWAFLPKEWIGEGDTV